MRILISLALVPLLGGCVASAIANTAIDIAKLPVKVATAGVDAVTTTQAEADQKRGREVRKAEERAGREARELQKRCDSGRSLPSDACPRR